MTHTTDQERAEFEAWYQPRLVTEVGESFERHLEGYWCTGVDKAWDIWQAARRAQAVQKGWNLRDAAQDALDWLEDEDLNLTHNIRERLRFALAAAPQPPEKDSLMSEIRTSKTVAAPVKIPDCAGKVLSDPDYDDGSISWRGGMPPQPGTKLYTEHQVRQLLAAHGIQERST